MNESINLPVDILEAFNNNSLAIFVGAGMSRLMGCKGWDELSNLLLEEFYNYKDSNQLINNIASAKEKITIAFNKCKQDGNPERFYDILSNALKPDEQSEDIYQHLIKFNCMFVTSNADGLLEKHLPPNAFTTNCTAEAISRTNQQTYLFYITLVM